MTTFEIALIGLGVVGVLMFTMAKVAQHYERRSPRKHKHA